jgi:hypothetical protein
VTSQFPDGLPPEVYPLAWIVGAWQGEGTIGYGPIEPGRVRQELVFTAADGPYLAYSARTWLAPDRDNPDSGGAAGAAKATGTQGLAARSDAAGGALWHQEAGFWRVRPGPARTDPPFEVEVLISDAAGYQSLYLGEVDAARVRLGTDAMVRTASAPAISAATRMYGLVGGELLWAWDIAGFGQPRGSYMAVQLRRTAP